MASQKERRLRNMNKRTLISLLACCAFLSTTAGVDSLVHAKTKIYNSDPNYLSAKELAIAFSKSSEHEKALYYFQESLKYATNRRDSSNSFNNTAAALMKLDRPDESIRYHRLSITMRGDEPRLLSQSYRNISAPFASIGQIDSALHYLDLSGKVYPLDSVTMHHNENKKGFIYEQSGQYEKAYNSYLNSYEYSQGDFELMRIACKNIAVAALYAGNKKEYDYWTTELITINEKERQQAAQAAESAALKQLQLENHILEEGLEKSRLFSWAIGVGALALILGAFLVFRERSNKKAKAMLRTFGMIAYNAKKHDQEALSEYLKSKGEDILGVSVFVDDRERNGQLRSTASDLFALSRSFHRKDISKPGAFSMVVQELCDKLKAVHSVPHEFHLDDTTPDDPAFIYALIEDVLHSLPYEEGVSRVSMKLKGAGNRKMHFDIMSSIPNKIFVRDELVALIKLKEGRVNLTPGPTTKIQIEI